MNFDEKEQNNVRTALRHLRRRVGAWTSLAPALHFAPDTLEKVVNGRRSVTLNMALRVAWFVGVPLDDLIAGRYLPGACPKCGHVPDFSDEPTVIEDAPRPEFVGLRLVK